MSRYAWNDDLDPRLRAEIVERTDLVVEAWTHDGATSSDLLATLNLASGRRVVVKGVRYSPSRPGNSRAARLVKEAMVLRAIPLALVPHLLHVVDCAGWLALVLDHIPGKAADLSPDSTQVDTVARTLATLATRRAVTPSDVRSLPTLAHALMEFRPWRMLRHLRPALSTWVLEHLDEWADLELEMIQRCEGDALMHTNLRRADLWVTQRAVSVLDWTSAQLAPPWVDLATFAALLVEHQHHPSAAEEEVSPASAWMKADPSAITAHAVITYGVWEWCRHPSNAGMVGDHAKNSVRADAWLRWAHYRWTRYPFRVPR